MKTHLPAYGRTVEEFVGRSERGDFNQALASALRSAQLTLGSEEIRWNMLQLGGHTAPGGHVLTVSIKARRADG